MNKMGIFIIEQLGNIVIGLLCYIPFAVGWEIYNKLLSWDWWWRVVGFLLLGALARWLYNVLAFTDEKEKRIKAMKLDRPPSSKKEGNDYALGYNQAIGDVIQAIREPKG